MKPTPSDIDISHAAVLLPIADVASRAGLRADEIEAHGARKAKVRAADVLAARAEQPDGSLVVVTGINPTPLGEGKVSLHACASQCGTFFLFLKKYVYFTKFIFSALKKQCYSLPPPLVWHKLFPII